MRDDDLLYGFLTLKVVQFQNMGTVDLNLFHTRDQTSCPLPVAHESHPSLTLYVQLPALKKSTQLLFKKQFTLKNKWSKYCQSYHENKC